MEQTPIQKQIEKVVTNGLGYRDSFGYALRRLDEALRRLDEASKYGQTGRDTELDLQMNLCGLEAKTAGDEIVRSCFWGMFLELCEIRQDLEKIGLDGKLKTPEDVHRALMGHATKYKIKQTRQEYKLIELIEKQYILKEIREFDRSIPDAIPGKDRVLRGRRKQELEVELKRQLRLSREAHKRDRARPKPEINPLEYVKEIGDDIRGSGGTWGQQLKD